MQCQSVFLSLSLSLFLFFFAGELIGRMPEQHRVVYFLAIYVRILAHESVKTTRQGKYFQLKGERKKERKVWYTGSRTKCLQQNWVQTMSPVSKCVQGWERKTKLNLTLHVTQMNEILSDKVFGGFKKYHFTPMFQYRFPGVYTLKKENKSQHPSHKIHFTLIFSLEPRHLL